MILEKQLFLPINLGSVTKAISRHFQVGIPANSPQGQTVQMLREIAKRSRTKPQTLQALVNMLNVEVQNN